MGKGREFEKEIARKLSLNWSDDARDDIFYCTSGSGSRATHRLKRGKNTESQFGDISYTDAIGKPFIDFFNIEAKTGYASKRILKDGTKSRTNWCILDCIDSMKTKLPETFEEFWQQSLRDAEISNREPLVIFRRPQRKTCISMRLPLFWNCRSVFGIPKFPHVILKNQSDLGEVIVMGFDNLLDWGDLKNLVSFLAKPKSGIFNSLSKKVLVEPIVHRSHKDKTAAAWAEYDKVAAVAWAEYEKVKAAAEAEYKKAEAPDWAEYNKVQAAAMAEYEKVTAPAWAEYNKVAAAAEAEYEKETQGQPNLEYTAKKRGRRI